MHEDEIKMNWLLERWWKKITDLSFIGNLLWYHGIKILWCYH